MAGSVEIASFKAASSTAKELRLFQVISRNSGYIFYHSTKKEKAKSDAEQVFSLASEFISDLPRGQGFSKTSAQWLRDVRELLNKWDRLARNTDKEWNPLGARIDRLERANWYHSAGTPAEFTGNSKISNWRFHKIGRTSAKVTEEAERLIRRHNDLKVGGLYKLAEGCCQFPSMENMEEFLTLECRSVTMDKIISSIHSHRSNFTQIYGPGGIGKTTMLAEIAKRIETNKNKFKRVVYVEVSRSPNIFEIQKKIAGQLSVSFEGTNQDVKSRADELRVAIENTGDKDEMVLIVLDDVWGYPSIKEIGIPSDGKVKVLIGTRMSDLPSEYRDNKISVGFLTDEDSWSFFTKAAGLDGTEIFIEVARSVKGQCFGLPLALAVIGSTLSGETDLITWKEALDYLKKSKLKKLKGKVNVEELLCRVIKYSYDHLDTNSLSNKSADTNSLPNKNPDTNSLEDKNHDTTKVPMAKEDKIARDIFRLCCLFPENQDIPREDLKKYLIAEDAKLKSKDFESSVRRLLKCHLLRSTVKPGILRMHAVVRDVAVYITKEEDSAFINCGTANRKTVLREEIVTSNKTVSVMGSNIETVFGFQFSSKLSLRRWQNAWKADRAKVQTLLLRENTQLSTLPDSFFEKMDGLTVLDLSYSQIEKLPGSMKKLKNVRTLLLNGCQNLKDVREIVALKGLLVLSLRESALQSLPTGMTNLVNLIVLDLSDAEECEIEVGFFSGLAQLEELFLASKSLSANAFIEIIELQKMRALRLCVYSTVLSSVEFEKKFENSDPLPKKSEFTKWSEFTMFFKKKDEHLAPASDFTISGHLNYPSMSQKKNLHIVELSTANRGVKLLLREAENLIIEECFPRENALDFLTPQGEKIFEKAKSLHLKNCGTIQYLTSGGSSEWENLEELELTELHEFEGIFKDTVSAGSFAIVREITFRMCKKIRYVMPHNVVQKVHEKLQKIKVIKCDMVKYIFDHNPDYSGSFSVLKLIELRGLLILTAIWKGIAPQGTFVKLKELIVIECHELAFVLTTTLADMLTSLQKLTVENNRELKAIIEWDGKAVLDNKVFPSVTQLSIQKLKKLEYFHGKPTDIDLEWPSLVQLQLGGCDALERFPIGEASAPHMTMVYLTSETDKSSTWYKKLNTKPPRFKPRVAYHLTEEDE